MCEQARQQAYDSMLQHVREAGIASTLHASNIRIVDPATPPPAPFKPSLPLNAALGLLTGSLLGIAFVFIRERADRSIALSDGQVVSDRVRSTDDHVPAGVVPR